MIAVSLGFSFDDRATFIGHPWIIIQSDALGEMRRCTGLYSATHCYLWFAPSVVLRLPHISLNFPVIIKNCLNAICLSGASRMRHLAYFIRITLHYDLILNKRNLHRILKIIKIMGWEWAQKDERPSNVEGSLDKFPYKTCVRNADVYSLLM